MKITDEAKQMLEQMLSENGAQGIRLYAVQGCCGPQYALSLEPPQPSDTQRVVNGISIAIDQTINATEGLTLDKEENEKGPGLVLMGANNCC